MKSASSLRIYAIAVPLICLVLGGVFLATQMTRMRGVETDLTQTQKNVDFVQGMIKILKEAPDANKEPAIPNTPDEQATFLNELRLLATNSGVELTRWSNTAVTSSSVDPNAKPQQNAVPTGVTQIGSSVEAMGDYQNLRAFMYSIMRSPRLLNIGNIQWTRGDTYPRTKMVFTLTRYVMAPTANTSVAMGSQPGTGTNTSGGN